MGYIRLPKHSHKQLTKHFNSDEFDCQGVGCCSETIINEKLLDILEMNTEQFGKPIKINSGYRCPVHNAAVGGAYGSRHTKGDAADTVVQGITPQAVAQFNESKGVKGIGLYNSFVHLDTRDVKSFWYTDKQIPKATFGNFAQSKVNVSSGNVQNNGLLMIGSKGDNVKKLQANLQSLGYAVEPDGDFGNRTKSAVMEFQKDKKIHIDGIAGKQTLEEIDKALKDKPISKDIYKVYVTTEINIRKDAGKNYTALGRLYDGDVVAICEEKSGQGANKWGKLSDNRGWIALDYCTKL